MLVFILNMENMEYWAVIRFLHLKDFIRNESSALDEGARSYLTVKNWMIEFKPSRTKYRRLRSERPKNITPPEIVDNIYNMFLKDRRLKLH